MSQLILLLLVKTLSWTAVSFLVGFTLLAKYRLRLFGIEHATYDSLYVSLLGFFAGCLAALYTILVTGNVWVRKHA
jgi:hypothetical protein